ncbi:uncharacterized protein BDV17DRAFT_289352 [Aspergillus undulatus]|uniref:uncharacterized protein n=1 Tax=Aspergillus undulatus TaxID=1810928 RepID=UPI003CCCBAD0
MADEYVDRKKHNLPFINILNEDGTLYDNAGPYADTRRFNVRYRVIEDLKRLGLIEGDDNARDDANDEYWAIHRYLYDDLFDIYIENSKSIISTGSQVEARSAMDTLYTALESGLRMLVPFMPFLTEELWQRLLRRPGDNAETASITIAKYPEYDPAFEDRGSEAAYELVLGCARGIRSLVTRLCG